MHWHVDFDAVVRVTVRPTLVLGHRPGDPPAHDGLIEPPVESDVVVNHVELGRGARIEVNLQGLTLQDKNEVWR